MNDQSKSNEMDLQVASGSGTAVPRQDKPKKVKSNPKKCEVCDKVFSSKSNLNAHIRSSHEGKRFYCDYDCPVSCSTKQSLERHVERWHSALYSTSGIENDSSPQEPANSIDDENTTDDEIANTDDGITEPLCDGMPEENEERSYFLETNLVNAIDDQSQIVESTPEIVPNLDVQQVIPETQDRIESTSSNKLPRVVIEDGAIQVEAESHGSTETVIDAPIEQQVMKSQISMEVYKTSNTNPGTSSVELQSDTIDEDYEPSTKKLKLDELASPLPVPWLLEKYFMMDFWLMNFITRLFKFK